METQVVNLQPAFFTKASASAFARSDVAVGVAISPRANELAIFTQVFSENSSKDKNKPFSTPRPLGHTDRPLTAKWGVTPASEILLRSESYVTFKHLQMAIQQREEEEIPFENSQNLEMLNRFVEMYAVNVQEHVDRIAFIEPLKADEYQHWSSVYTTLQLFQTLLTPQSGLMTGLVGEELLLWLNTNFVAPTTEEGRRFASKDKPWAEAGFWRYLIRATIRGISQGALHFFQILSKHPASALRHIAPRLLKVLESHPRSTQISTEQEFFGAHRRWRESVRLLRSELDVLEDSREDWREGLEDLVGVLEGREDVIMKVCSEENGGSGWREVLGVWGVWVHVDFRRQDLPDTLAIINDVVPLDASQPDEAVQAALVSQQLKRFVVLAAEYDPWLGAHVMDLMEKMNIVFHATPISSSNTYGDEEDEVPDDALRLRDYLIMDYADEVLHSDPQAWEIELDYLASCGDVGRARLGAVLRHLAVDIEVDPEEKSKPNGFTPGDDMYDDEENLPTLEKLTGLQRVAKLIGICTDYQLFDEMESLCRVVARLLVQQRRYGDAVSYCIYGKDVKMISRIVDLLLEEYISQGAEEFISLADGIPDVTEVLLGSPGFTASDSHLGMTIRSRLDFLTQYAEYHRQYRDGKKRDAARLLMQMLLSGVVPKWWWGVILIDAGGLCGDDEMLFEEYDAYDLQRHVEEIYMRAEQGCGADYLGALEKITSQNNTSGKTEDPIKQLEAVRLALARYLGRCFTMARQL